MQQDLQTEIEALRAIYGDAALSARDGDGETIVEAVLGGGVLTGAWLGVFIGLVLGLLTDNPGQALVTGVIAGVIFGLITSSIPYAMSKGTRDFSSTMQLVAGRYDVLCDPQSAERARDMLSRLTL